MNAESEGKREPGAYRMGGIVLSAGRSARMGEPKALLDFNGRTFLASAVDALRAGGCSAVVAVVAEARVADAVGPDAGGPDAGGPAVAGADAAGAGAARGEELEVRVVWNVAPGSEQLDSLRAGLGAMPDDVVGAIVLPVDHPLVRPETVRALLDAGRSNPDAVIRPTLDGVPGHPTLFPRVVWPRLHDPSLPSGARSVVESPDTRTVDVPVRDGGVLADIDTPAAYRRYVGERHESAGGETSGLSS